ncbi:hypothetical protein JN11_01212 [Mucilaginibacter frigoritolerans]|uniref:Uncharacterized protein n=1 Tax=Mucilaginibacter frigoritolerans TaxID=652788 RepID=A0A562U8Z0_9SPHI|nr:ACT domain-containing protein [Mucilaginibacter frigoritolerans]TWJ02240.1 hypothetical protein JN11_01212 [Mucilaginibacter frigoritolerans]
MPGETNLTELLKTMHPTLNEGDYVFCTISSSITIDHDLIIGSFKEKEGLTIILSKDEADKLNLTYSYIATWITLTVHSSLEAVGLTAAFATELSKNGISCNVVAAYYHDHIFVAKKDAVKAMDVLQKMADK